MKAFRLRAARGDGAIESLTVSAPSLEAAIRDVGSRGLVVLDARAAEHGASRVRLSRRALEEFTRSMAMLLRSGITVRDALEICESMFAAGAARQLSRLLRDALSRGEPFAEAVSACSHSLPLLYESMVRIGERVGSLATVFDRLSQYLADSKRLRDRVAGALAYPSIVLATPLAGAGALVTVVVPRMTAVFEEIGAELPPSYAVGKGATVALMVVFGALATLSGACAVALRASRRRGKPLAALERLVLAVPILGSYVVLRDTLNLSFALEALTGSGLCVEDALRDAAGVLASREYRSAIMRAREAVLRGERLSAAMSEARPIPERVVRWARLGERIGAVEKVFGQIRTYYQEEVERWSTRIAALAEPVLILFVGAIILMLVVALIVPFLSLYGSVSL